MYFELSEEQKSLIAFVKDFCQRELRPEIYLECQKIPITKENPLARVPQDLLKKIREVGLNAFTVPEKYGGGGISDLVTVMLLAETAGQVHGELCQLFVGGWTFNMYLAAILTEEQQDELFPQVMKVDEPWGIAERATEPNHGTDIQFGVDEAGGCDTFAYRDGDEYVINGEKCLQTGSTAPGSLVHTRTDKTKPFRESTSLLVVPPKTPGVYLESIHEGMTAGGVLLPSGTIIYDNVRVPARWLVGEENKGYALFEKRRPQWIIDLARGVGWAQMVYEFTKEYARTRIQGGKPIYQHPNVAERIAHMCVQIEATRALIYKTAWQYDKQGLFYNPLGYQLCYGFAFGAFQQVAADAAEILGGYSALREMPVQDFLRYAWGWSHGFATPSMNLIMATRWIYEEV